MPCLYKTAPLTNQHLGLSGAPFDKLGVTAFWLSFFVCVS